MNKNTIIYAAIVVSIAMVGFIVFSGQQDFETQYTSLKASGELSKTVNPTKDVEVKYQNTSSPAEDKVKEKIKREKFVEYKTIDDSKKFEIALINEQSWEPEPRKSTSYKIYGKIDNNNFVLKVPSYLVKNKNDLKIRINNTQTGESQTIPAPFVMELAGQSGTNHVSINSNDASNYTVNHKEDNLPSFIDPNAPAN